jgi:5S rRNA maturation endonuclease (ribonuclease M5)
VTLLDDLERFEKLEELIQEVKQLSDEGAVIIVEGRRDKKALQELGITGIIKLGTQKSLLVFCEEIARTHKNVIVLTDWDQKGDKLATLMKAHLQNADASVNMDLRNKIKNLVQKRIKDIESLDTHLFNLKSELRIDT